MTVALVKLQSTTVTVIVAVFFTVTFVAVRAKQILNQCNPQLGHNKAKLEMETSQNTVNIFVVTVTFTVNVNVTDTVTVTPATV